MSFISVHLIWLFYGNLSYKKIENLEKIPKFWAFPSFENKNCVQVKKNTFHTLFKSIYALL